MKVWDKFHYSDDDKITILAATCEMYAKFHSYPCYYKEQKMFAFSMGRVIEDKYVTLVLVGVL